MTLSQPARNKDPPKNDPKTTKTQLQSESSHKWHKGYSKNIKLRKSETAQVPQVSYHRRLYHKDRKSKQINLRSRNKQEGSPKVWR